GHEEASGTKYIPPQLFEEWGKKDPVMNYENYLLQERIIDEDQIAATRKNIKAEIEINLEITFSEENPHPETDKEVLDVYDQSPPKIFFPSSDKKTELRY